MKTKINNSLLALTGLLATGIIVSCTHNQSGDNIYANQPAKVSSVKPDSMNNSPDAKFLVKVSQINKEEIKLGQLAEQNGTMPDVKELGKMMERDHVKAEEDLNALTQKKSITIPVTTDDNAQNDYNKLSVKSGNDFDKSFCDMMVSGHKDAIDLFQKESTDGKDSDIRQFAQASLNTLQMHLDHSKMCLDKVK